MVRQCGCLLLALAEALEEAATEEFDTSWLPDLEQRSVEVVPRFGAERLDSEAKACLLACAVFGADVAIPETALLRQWSGILPSETRGRRMVTEWKGGRC